MSFRKIGEFVSPWLVRLATRWACVALVALLTFGCSACLAFGFLALVSALWLARLACLLAVILSVAKNPYFKFMDTSLTLSMTSKLCLLGCLTDSWLLGLPCFWLFGLPFGSAFFALLGWLGSLFEQTLPCSLGSLSF